MPQLKIKKTEQFSNITRDMLGTVEQQIGFLPNVFTALAESPSALASFIQLNKLFSHASFDAQSREIILLATSVENECAYCVAGHTAFALDTGIDNTHIESIRNRNALDNARLEALTSFTQAVVQQRGHITSDQLQTFLLAGYNQRNVIDVVLGITIKIMSNFTSNITQLELDEPLQKFTWVAAV